MENGQLASGTGPDMPVGAPDHLLVHLPLDQIRIDPRVQARAEIVQEVVDEYAEAMREGAKFPRLTVLQDEGTYILADGFTRHNAAKLAGLTGFDCDVRPGGLRDAIFFAAGANATHGRPRSKDDKRKAVLHLLNDPEWQTWSDREIARHCHVGHQLVAELRTITGRPTSERIFRTKHGSTAKMKVDKIGKNSKSRSCKPGGHREGGQELALLQASASEALTRDAAESAKVEDSDAHTPAIYAAICDLPSRGSSIKPEGSEPASNFELDQSKPASIAVLVEFAKFILARITQGKKIVLRLTAVEDEKEFSRLTNRVRLVLRQQG
jgi:hypothetical protein